MAKYFMAFVVCIVIFGFALWWKIYEYNDCILVGHTKLYCIGKALSK